MLQLIPLSHLPLSLPITIFILFLSGKRRNFKQSLLLNVVSILSARANRRKIIREVNQNKKVSAIPLFYYANLDALIS